jgi:hypothetical protein
MGSFKILGKRPRASACNEILSTPKEGTMFLNVKKLLNLYFKVCGKDNFTFTNYDILCSNLWNNRAVLWDYFSIEITFATVPNDGETIENSNYDKLLLTALPSLIEGYIPDTASIPILTYRLACVNYNVKI